MSAFSEIVRGEVMKFNDVYKFLETVSDPEVQTIAQTLLNDMQGVTFNNGMPVKKEYHRDPTEAIALDLVIKLGMFTATICEQLIPEDPDHFISVLSIAS